MAPYKVMLRISVTKDLQGLPKKDAERIVKAINGLANGPRPPQARKLIGDTLCRLRCGVYRVLYEIQDNNRIVCVVGVWHRRGDFVRG